MDERYNMDSMDNTVELHNTPREQVDLPLGSESIQAERRIHSKGVRR